MAGNWTAQFGAWTVGVVQVEGRSVGTGVPLYSATAGSQFSVLEFKSLVGGAGIELSDADGEITVNATARMIDHFEINSAGHLIVFYSDDTSQDLGQVSAPTHFIAAAQHIPPFTLQATGEFLGGLLPGHYALSGGDAALVVTAIVAP